MFCVALQYTMSLKFSVTAVKSAASRPSDAIMVQEWRGRRGRLANNKYFDRLDIFFPGTHEIWPARPIFSTGHTERDTRAFHACGVQTSLNIFSHHQMQAHILNQVRQSFDQGLHDVWQKVHNIIFWDSTTYNTQINLDIWWKAQNTTKPFQDAFLRCRTLISNSQLICPSLVQVWQQYYHFNRNTNICFCRKVLRLTLKSKWVGKLSSQTGACNWKSGWKRQLFISKCSLKQGAL